MMSRIELHRAVEDDISVFFEMQLDATANHMVAFTAQDSTNRVEFIAHWMRLLNDDGIRKRTILLEDCVVGYIVGFEHFGLPSVSYWVAKAQ